MNPLNLDEVREYVNTHISDFHDSRLNTLNKLKLSILLAKNPYLFKAKNVTTAPEFVGQLLEAFLSSSEEKMFGSFLEDLAIFVAEKTSGGHKSTAQGVDLEFIYERNHYLVSIKSGPHWGNSSQQNQLARDLSTAVMRLKQSSHLINPIAVLGICYGKTKTSYLRGYMKVVGQNFWYLISHSKTLYTDIIEPLGYRAKEHNEAFLNQRSNIINKLNKEFLDAFCDPSSWEISWEKVVEACCGNFDLDQYIP